DRRRRRVNPRSPTVSTRVRQPTAPLHEGGAEPAATRAPGVPGRAPDRQAVDVSALGGVVPADPPVSAGAGPLGQAGGLASGFGTGAVRAKTTPAAVGAQGRASPLRAARGGRPAAARVLSASSGGRRASSARGPSGAARDPIRARRSY